MRDCKMCLLVATLYVGSFHWSIVFALPLSLVFLTINYYFDIYIQENISFTEIQMNCLNDIKRRENLCKTDSTLALFDLTICYFNINYMNKSIKYAFLSNENTPNFPYKYFNHFISNWFRQHQFEEWTVKWLEVEPKAFFQLTAQCYI